MVRIKITPRKKAPRKKRVRWLDEVQADSSRPRASYTSPPTTDADIMKFINKKATEQKQNRQLEWWEKLASPTKAQWAYANAVHRAEEYARKRGALRPTSLEPNNVDALVVIRPYARRNPPNKKPA